MNNNESNYEKPQSSPAATVIDHGQPILIQQQQQSQQVQKTQQQYPAHYANMDNNVPPLVATAMHTNSNSHHPSYSVAPPSSTYYPQQPYVQVVHPQSPPSLSLPLSQQQLQQQQLYGYEGNINPLPAAAPPLPPGVQYTGIGGFEFSYSGRENWRGDICACCSIACIPTCVMATFVPCIPLGQLAHKARVMPFKWVVAVSISLWVLTYYITTVFDYNVTLLYSLFVFAVLFATRSKIRLILGIQGSHFDDCCCSFWCSCCAIAQLARTVFNYQEGDNCSCGENGEPFWWQGIIPSQPFHDIYPPPLPPQQQVNTAVISNVLTQQPLPPPTPPPLPLPLTRPQEFSSITLASAPFDNDNEGSRSCSTPNNGRAGNSYSAVPTATPFDIEHNSNNVKF